MEAAFIFHCLSEAFSFPNVSPRETCRILEPLSQFPKDNKLVDSINATTLDDLQAEYTRLFINAPHKVPAPPYASVYLSEKGQLFQDGYDDAVKFYLDAGLEPVQGPEPADNIFYELEFVAMLLEYKKNDLLCSFLESHLLKWYPKFLDNLLAANPHIYYDVIARFTMSNLEDLKKEVCHEV